MLAIVFDRLRGGQRPDEVVDALAVQDHEVVVFQAGGGVGCCREEEGSADVFFLPAEGARRTRCVEGAPVDVAEGRGRDDMAERGEVAREDAVGDAIARFGLRHRGNEGWELCWTVVVVVAYGMVTV